MEWTFAELPHSLDRLCVILQSEVSQESTPTSSASFCRLLSAIHSFTVEGRWEQLLSCTCFSDIVSKPNVPVGDWILGSVDAAAIFEDFWFLDPDELNHQKEVSLQRFLVRK